MKTWKMVVLTVTVLLACVGVSWGKDPPMGQWIKEETKDRWGDVSGYTYMQWTMADGRGENGRMAKWGLGVIYTEDNAIGIAIAPTTVRVPPFVFIRGELGTIPASISLRDENKNAKDFFASYIPKTSGAELYLLSRERDLVNMLKNKGKFTILITLGIEGIGQQSWSVRGSIVGGLPKNKTDIEQEKREEEKRMEQKAEQARLEKERLEREGIKNSRQQFTDPRNGKKYLTVKIGDKTWMAENLNYKTSSSWCYDDDEFNCDKYGRLYDWNTAKSVCPIGWHLPSRQEWVDLFNMAGSGGIACKRLKSSDGWDEGGNGTDDFGWSALPGGYRSSGSSFRNIGTIGYWWTDTEYGNVYAYRQIMGYDYVNENSDYKSSGHSVRCVGND